MPSVYAFRTVLVAGAAILMGLPWAAAQGSHGTSGEILAHIVTSERLVCRVVSGQIRVFCPRAFTAPIQKGESTERISLRPTEDGARVEYELKTPSERFVFEVSGLETLRLRREHGEPAKREVVDLLQTQSGAVKLTVGPVAQPKVYEAPGFWHLLIAERDVCRQHLYPLLARVRRDWNLDERLDTIEEELLRLACGSGVLEHRRWAALVGQLADDRFGRREAAERELRAAGPAVRGFLEQLDFNRLEAEQQARMRRILHDLPCDEDDDPPALAAALLLNAPPVWLGMLSRPQAATRRAAAEQLSKLLAAPVRFDVEADPAVRQRQIDELRARISSAPRNR